MKDGINHSFDEPRHMNPLESPSNKGLNFKATMEGARSLSCSFTALIVLVLLACSLIRPEKGIAQTTFTEDAASYNLDIGGAKDGGHGWSDFDLDGDFDILINTSQNAPPFRSFLMRNDGGSFTDVTNALAPYLKNSALERCANWGDLNSDGYPDFVRNTSWRMEVYLQDPATNRFGDGMGGTTPQIFTSANIADGFNSEGIGFIDFDSDGDYDIVFDNHNFGVDILENDGNGIFQHITQKANSPNPPYDVNDASTWPYGLVQDATDGDYGSATDYNNDGFVDFAARKQDQVDFFRNIGGTFVDGIEIGQADNNNKGSISLQDFDNDRDFDLFWTENGLNQIWENQNGAWVPLGAATGIPTTFSTSIDGIACGDVDNDGDVDIFLAGDNRGFLYINQMNDPIGGRNTGAPMSFVVSPQVFHSGRDGEGSTFIDIDEDGDLDLYVNINGQANHLYINQLSGPSAGNYMYLDVTEARAAMGLEPGQEMMALGATMMIRDCNGNIISGIREVNGGTGHGTMDPPRIHFGLPDGPDVQYVFSVAFPVVDGERMSFRYVFTPSAAGSYNLVTAEPQDLILQSPVAADDNVEVCPGGSITFDPLADNGNGPDTDPDGDALTVNEIEQPLHGTTVLNPDGTVTYTPDPGYVGSDSFNYTMNDEPFCMWGGLEATGEVNVTVNQPPTGTSTVAETAANMPLVITAPAGVAPNLLADYSDTDPISINPATGSSDEGGSFEVNADGTYTYTPPAGFTGVDSFDFEVCDACGCVTQTIFMNVEPDFDQDGIADYIDLDDDNDGIFDTFEDDCGAHTTSISGNTNLTGGVSEIFVQGEVEPILSLVSTDPQDYLQTYQWRNNHIRSTAGNMEDGVIIGIFDNIDEVDEAELHLDFGQIVNNLVIDIGDLDSMSEFMEVYAYSGDIEIPLDASNFTYVGPNVDYDGTNQFEAVGGAVGNNDNRASIRLEIDRDVTRIRLVCSDDTDDFFITLSAVEYCYYPDADGDGNPNSQDLDSDNDGCSDVDEAGFTDANDDGLLGPLAPPAVDGNGTVTSY